MGTPPPGDWVVGETEMAKRIRAFDWASTPLGPISAWPQSLRTVVGLMLASSEPAYIAWGPENTSLYNDGYIPILGAKHPAGLASPFAKLWPEIWDEYRPILEATMAGEAQHFIDRPVPLAGRPGCPMSWFTFSWTPVRDEGGAVAGFYCAATETTTNVVGGIAELKRAEDALRQSEERFRVAQELSPDGFIIFRPLRDHTGAVTDFLWIYENDAAARMNDTNPKAVCGKRVSEVLPHHDQSPFHKAYKEVAEKGEVRVLEEAFYDQDTFRQGRWFRVAAVPTPGGDVAVLVQNVTERKMAEEARRESLERLQKVLEAQTVGVMFWDLNTGCMIDANDTFLDLMGYSRAEVEARELTWQRLTPPEYIDVSRGEIEKFLATGRIGPYEKEYFQKDGAKRWLLFAGSSLGNNQCVEFCIDISDRKRAEEALRETEAQFRTLANAIPTLCWMANADGWITWYNDRWYEYTGTSPEQMEGWGWQSVHDPEMLPSVMERWKSSLATAEPFEMVFPLRGADGVFRQFLTRIVPVRDREGSVVRWFGTNTDISEQRKTEEALRQSEARERARAGELEGILDAAPVALFIAKDPECRNMIGSRMTYDMLRLSPGANVSKSAPDGDVPQTFKAMQAGREIPPDELPAQRAASTGQVVRDFEFDVVYNDRTVRNMLGSAVPLFDESGKPRGAVGAFVDITESKRTEERLRQTQKLESIGLLAGGIAHDFNNLLTGVMGNASLLLEDAPPERAETLRSIIASTERAAHLTRQLLAYSGKGQFIVRELDITQAVNEMADLVQFSIPKSVGLSLNLDRRLPPVEMDPGQLQQILMNLVINAGEAIGDGNPGRITVSTSMADVETPITDDLGEAIAPGRYVCVEVHDTGCGIDAEKKAKIFDPFFTTKFVGRGLGLAAVAGILRSQRGGIVVESAPGEGSAFRVFLPATGRAALAVQEPGSQDGRPFILVVDDETAVRDFISAVLRRRGYHVIEASDGQQALALCASAPGVIGAAIVDIIMPNMSANDLLPALKAKQPGMRILLTSGYSEAEARRLCAAYPGASFIQKPYTAQQLAKVVEEVVGASAS